MKKSDITKTNKTSLVVALSRLPSSDEWFKMSSQEKERFERARREEEQVKKEGFVIGGSVKQITNDLCDNCVGYMSYYCDEDICLYVDRQDMEYDEE